MVSMANPTWKASMFWASNTDLASFFCQVPVDEKKKEWTAGATEEESGDAGAGRGWPTMEDFLGACCVSPLELSRC